jgi:Ca-activated chloride channel homolog
MLSFLDPPDWAHPWYLLAVLAAVPAVLLALRSAGRVVFSSLAALPVRGSSWRTALVWVPDALVALAIACLGIALAGPRAGEKDSRVHKEGIAIVMTVDTSSSMAALDLSRHNQEQTRLDAVEAVFRRFVTGGPDLRGRPDDAIGLVSFARYADTRSPITLDHDDLLTALGAVHITKDRNEDGTAIGDGLALAVDRLRGAKARSRVVVLLTDGMNNAGAESPLGAAEWARQEGIKVYTIGAGTNGMAPVRVQTPMGSELVAQPVQIDEDLLRKIADTTGGRYFRATDAGSLASIYQEIDALERTKMTETRFLEYREYYPYWVAAGLILAALAFLLRGSVFRRLP